jgi:CheY-like chemotaxis protein
VLDWLLPDFDGIEVLRRLRGRGLATPVLMLTARDTLHDRLTGLDTGADDYLGKPFAFAELLARARALLRRPSWSDGRLLQFGDLRLDTRTRIAIRNGQEIPLTPREVDLLEYLLRYQGETVTREMLARDVWKETRRCTSLDNVIDVQLTRLRRKVESGRELAPHPDGARGRLPAGRRRRLSAAGRTLHEWWRRRTVRFRLALWVCRRRHAADHAFCDHESTRLSPAASPGPSTTPCARISRSCTPGSGLPATAVCTGTATC